MGACRWSARCRPRGPKAISQCGWDGEFIGSTGYLTRSMDGAMLCWGRIRGSEKRQLVSRNHAHRQPGAVRAMNTSASEVVNMADEHEPKSSPTIVRFPQSRTRIGPREPAKDLGLSVLSQQVGSSGRSAKGHWCSVCKGIWYSYFLESECPVCGNRHG